MIRRHLLFSFLFCLTFCFGAFAQNGNFRSLASGNWNDPNSWERDADSNGTYEDSPSDFSPLSTDGTVIIQNGHTITFNASLTVDQITIESGGVLTINSGITLTLGNYTAGDGIEMTIASGGTVNNNGVFNFVSFNTRTVIVNGTINNLGTFPGITGGELTFNSGATYNHNFTNGGIIPTASWNSNSNCVIAGYGAGSTTVPTSGLSQNFGNFVWNCPNQDNPMDLGGFPNSVSGNFQIIDAGSAGGGYLVYKGSGAAPTLAVGGSLSVANGMLVLSTGTTGEATITINGGLTVSGGTLFLADDQNATIGVVGDLSVSNGTLDFSASAANTTINLEGNYTHSSGTLTVSAGSGTVNFAGNSTQTVTATTAPGLINFNVLSGSTVVLAGNNFLGGSGDLIVDGTIQVGSTATGGAIQNGGSNGNIRVTGSRTYNSGAVIVYNGSAAQFLSSGHPSASGITTQINNSNGVTLATSSVTIGGNLALVAGNLTIGSRTLILGGTFTPNANSLVVTTGSSLTINGTGAFGTLEISGSSTINNFTINRTSSGSVTLGDDLTVSGTFAQTAGTLVLNGFALRINGNYSATSGTFTSANAASSLIIEGAGTMPASVSFVSGATLGTLTMDRASATLTTGATLTVNNLNLLDGTFNNTGTVSISGTITREAGTLNFAVGPSATSYNVRYTNSGNINSGPELPTSTTHLNDLTKDGSGTLTLAQGTTTVNGTLRFNDGIFDANTRTLDVKGNMVTVGASSLTSATVIFSGNTTLTGAPNTPTFGTMTITGTLTPNTLYQINGNITNSGTLNAGNGTTTFGGTTAITGAGTTNFNNIVISGTLTSSSGSVGIAGNFISTGTFTHNGGTIDFNGTTSSITTGLTFNNITVSGAFSAPAAITLVGNWTNNGTFTRGTGTVTFAGTSAQLIQGSALTEFNNIMVTNATSPLSVQVLSNTDMHGTLTLSTNSIFDADGTTGNTVFRLRSTGDSPTVDAAIATLPTGAQISGSVTVQRYMSIESGPSGNNRIYRNISSAVSGATAAQVKVFIPISGTFTGANHTGSQSMFEYVESVTTDTNGSGIADLNDGYIDFPATADTEVLATAKGYNIFIRGNETPISTAGNALFEVRGAPNVGPIASPINFNTTFNSSGDVANDGWNLVGNPFPSTIDWNSASGWTKGAGVTATIYIRDNGGNPARFATWNGVTGTNGGSRYIPLGQAFWVKTDGSGASTLTADERVKTGGTQSTFFREAQPTDLLRITLKQGNVEDETVIHFRENATEHFDSFADAVKMKNASGITSTSTPMFNLASLDTDMLSMAINSLPALTCGATVTLNLTEVSAGNYALNFSEFESFSENVKIELHDSFAASISDIRNQQTYQFQVTTDPASYGSQRFQIVFSQSGAPALNYESSSVACENSSVPVTIKNSQASAVYSIHQDNSEIVSVNGNGGDLLLQIPKELLVKGANMFSVKSRLVACDQVATANDLTIDVQEKPVIATESALRCNEGEITMAASGASEGNYRWYATESGDDRIENATSSLLTVNLYKTKTYYVSAVNSAGCEGSRVAVKAEISIPQSVSSVLSTSVCSGEPASLQASGASSGATYRWYESESATASILGETSNTLTTGELFASKTYYVSIINAKGCEGARVPVTAEVLNLEPPVITVDGSTLTSSVASGNQWYLNGNLIEGATGQDLKVTESGVYKLEVTSGSCTVSSELEFLVMGLEDPMGGVSIFPNPTASNVFIKTNSAGNLRFQLFTSQAVKVEQGLTVNGEGSISLSAYPPGIYFLYIQDGNKILRKKIVRK
jgi:hypothetical protein